MITARLHPQQTQLALNRPFYGPFTTQGFFCLCSQLHKTLIHLPRLAPALFPNVSIFRTIKGLGLVLHVGNKPDPWTGSGPDPTLNT